MKTCSKCKQNKSEQDFYKRSKEGGIRYSCKTCLFLENRAKRGTPLERFERYKYGAKIRKIEFLVSFDDFMTFWQKDCAYCGGSIKTIGLDRIDNSIGYQLNNITPCCATCNRFKCNLEVEQFINHCKKIASNF